MKKKLKQVLKIMMVFACLISSNAFARGSANSKPETELTLIPPSPVTDKITLDIRGSLWNRTEHTKKYRVTIYLDQAKREDRLYSESLEVGAKSAAGVRCLWPTRDRAGDHKIILVVRSDHRVVSTAQPLVVLASKVSSTERIGGAWVGVTHWSEKEGKPWNAQIKKMTDTQWQQLVRGMHRVGMNIIVIQQVFENNVYNNSLIRQNGFHGLAYYPSKLYPGRMPITAKDPIRAILSQADKLGMHVFLGVGMYAWFDYSHSSLVWHEKVAKELWKMYGQHPSFYGWYISEEKDGGLGDSVQRRQIVNFFKKFTPFVDRMAPGKPVMLATNCWHLRGAESTYQKLLPHLDILCPFAFDRMPKGGETGEQAGALLARLCRESGTHLWLDMEVFVFDKHGGLIPRPISGVVGDLHKYTGFEETLCYQYPGLLTSPRASVKLGGARAVKLYEDYQTYLRGLPK
ncbi:MAG: DUF4434 domain-containing protein [Bacteroidetes bacterium]|nr:DUF4434 domain-containing protein [Bacteroidota bacterium]